MRDGIWDAANAASGVQRNEKDYPFINLDDKEEVLTWLINDLDDKIESREDRLRVIERLDRMFEGEPYEVGARTRDEDYDNLNSRKKSSIFNYVCEMVEAKMSQRSKFKSAFQVIPSKVSVDDENRSESVKMLLKAKGNELGFENLLSKGDKELFIAGEQYSWIRWNPYKGGMTTISEDEIESEPFYRGDVDIKILGPDRAFHQLNKSRWEDVDDISIIEFVHIDEIKADYPHVGDDLVLGNSSVFETLLRRENYDQNYKMVVHYFRRPNRFLTTGAYYKYCYDAILEGGNKYPYRDNLLPVVYDTDIDLRGKNGGKPFASNIEKLQRLHDMLSTSTARAFAIGSSPKWLYPKGAVDPNKLSNNYSSVEYKGPNEPKLVSFTAVPQGSDAFMGIVERGIEKGSAVFGGARGEPPRGVKSAVALQFLNEQETQRESYGMSKRQERAGSMYKMLLSRCQQFYTPQDGRIFKYFGEDNSYLISSFETMDISGDYDIFFENSSSLPDTKSGRIASIIDLNQATPQDPLFKREQIAQMLDLGNDKRFRSEAQASLKSAQSKLQKVLYGDRSIQPRDWDDFLTEYPIFVKSLRERAYKGTSPEIEAGLIEYIRGMEALIWEKTKLNPAYMMAVGRIIPEFPIFLRIPMITPQPAEPVKEKAVTEMKTLQQGEQ